MLAWLGLHLLHMMTEQPWRLPESWQLGMCHHHRLGGSSLALFLGSRSGWGWRNWFAVVGSFICLWCNGLFVELYHKGWSTSLCCILNIKISLRTCLKWLPIESPCLILNKTWGTITINFADTVVLSMNLFQSMKEFLSAAVYGSHAAAAYSTGHVYTTKITWPRCAILQMGVLSWLPVTCLNMVIRFPLSSHGW